MCPERDPGAAPECASTSTRIQLKFPLFRAGSAGAPDTKGVYQRALQPPGARRVRFRAEVPPDLPSGRAMLKNELNGKRPQQLTRRLQRLRDRHPAAWDSSRMLTLDRLRRAQDAAQFKIRLREAIAKAKAVASRRKQALAAIQPAPWPDDPEPEDDITRTLRHQGLVAEAGTYHLPDDNSDPELKETEENLTKLASIRPDTGVDPTAGRWGPHEVKVLVDTGASGSFTSETVAQRLKMRPQRHEKEMRVQVVDGSTYDANSCIRPKLAAETRKGVYLRQVELRVMPLHLGVDIVLGGDWLRSLQRVTLDYTGRGSIAFGTGSRR
eukprot:gene34378-biopygen27843